MSWFPKNANCFTRPANGNFQSPIISPQKPTTMKKMMLYALAITFCSTGFCQQTNTVPPAVKTDYLKKSKKQKTAAWILLGGGFAASVIGISIAASDLAEDGSAAIIGGIVGEEIETETSYTGDILFFTGLASMAGSIPLFVASSRNKKKAAALNAGIKIDNISIPRQAALNRVQYPALSLKIGL